MRPTLLLGFLTALPALALAAAEDIAPFEPTGENALAPAMEAAPLEGIKDRAVIGKDSRVHQRNTTSYPFKTMGLLRMFTGSSAGICSGTLVAKQYVLTAAHCVYDSEENSFSDRIVFYPGRDGNTVPYGGYGVSRAYLPKSYVSASEVTSSGDYALLKLRDPAGDELGWMGMRVTQPMPEHIIAEIESQLSDNPSYATFMIEKLNKQYPEHTLQYFGYSGDKDLEPWGDQCIYHYENGNDNLRTYCDGQGGSSGSGIYMPDNYVTAIISNTSYGSDARVTSSGDIYGDIDSTANNATAVNANVMHQLKRWLKDDYGSETQVVNFADDDNVNFVTVKNGCYKPIYVALRYRSIDDGWTTNGFWELDSREKKRLVLTESDYLYYYAESTDGRNSWAGDDRYSSLYGEKYGFRKRNIDTNWQLELTCD